MTRALLLAATLVALPAAALGGPRIAADADGYDYGTVDETQEVEHVFTLRNTGDAPLSITKVEASCGCTTTQLGGTVISPGGTTNLTARINLKGRRGKQNKTILVSSNDPQQPSLTLRLTGTVTADVDLVPNRVDFLDLREDQAASRTFLLVNNSASPLKVLKAESASPAFNVRLDQLEAGRRWQMTVTTVPPLQQGFTRGVVTLATDNSRYATLTVPVSAQVPSDIIVVPGVVAVGDNPGKPASAWLAVRSRSGKKFRLAGVTAPFPEIRTRVENVDGSSWKVEVSNLVSSPKLTGTALRIHVEGSPRELRVPIQVYKAPPPRP